MNSFMVNAPLGQGRLRPWAYRLMPTFTRWQILLTGQVEHNGEMGLQTFWPQVTSNAL